MNLLDYDHSPRIASLARRLKDRDSISILFICLGNICRSPAADAIMRDKVAAHPDCRIQEIDSAGIGSWHVGDLPDARMRAHGRQRGLKVNHVCRQVRELDFDRFDLIIGMDEGNLRNLHQLAMTREDDDKIYAMAEFFSPGSRWYEVPDPYYDGDEGFETVLDLLEEGTQNILDTLG